MNSKQVQNDLGFSKPPCPHLETDGSSGPASSFCKFRDSGNECFAPIHDLLQASCEATSKTSFRVQARGNFAAEQELPDSQAH